MGCTSSAPNMPPSQTNSVIDLKHIEETGEKSMAEADEVIHSDKENETNRIKVLPTCDIDNLGDSTQLARNNKSFIDTSSLDLDKEFHGNGHIMDGDNVSNEQETSENSQTDEKLSKLEEVVEKVVELYVADAALEDSQNEKISDDDATESTDKAQVEAQAVETQNATKTETNEQKTENGEEMASPSQSESSRATRWEALADIAAELPPSLAVDPITGQIYSLSK